MKWNFFDVIIKPKYLGKKCIYTPFSEQRVFRTFNAFLMWKHEIFVPHFSIAISSIHKCFVLFKRKIVVEVKENFKISVRNCEFLKVYYFRINLKFTVEIFK